MDVFRLADDISDKYVKYFCGTRGGSLRISDWAIKGGALDSDDLLLSCQESGNALIQPDFFRLYGIIPVFSDNAVNALGSHLRKHGELLRIRCTDGQYSLYRVSKLVDCLNIGLSDITMDFRGNIENYRTLTLGNTIDPEIVIFRVPQLLVEIFVTGEFRKAVISANLSGFLFADLSTSPISIGKL